jgi:hypothetical protein
MRPPYLRDLDDYLYWVGQLIDWSGGTLEDPDYLRIEETFATGRPGGIDERSVLIEDHHLRFADGTRLVFNMLLVETVDAETMEPLDVELSVFKFQYLTAEDKRIWRCENHEGHEDEEGRPVHFHSGDEDPVPCEDMDLDDALKKVYEEAG